METDWCAAGFDPGLRKGGAAVARDTRDTDEDPGTAGGTVSGLYALLPQLHGPLVPLVHPLLLPPTAGPVVLLPLLSVRGVLRVVARRRRRLPHDAGRPGPRPNEARRTSAAGPRM